MTIYEERNKKRLEQQRQYERRKRMAAAAAKAAKGAAVFPKAAGTLTKDPNFEKVEFWVGDIGLVMRQGERVLTMGPRDAIMMACAILGVGDCDIGDEPA